MKKTKYALFAAFCSLALFFTSCTGDDEDLGSSPAVIDASSDDDVLLHDNTGKSDIDTRKETGKSKSESSEIVAGDTKVTVKDGDFLRGFDASSVDYYETVGRQGNTSNVIRWKDTDGTEKEFFEILALHGVNAIRLRIWNEPSQKVDGTLPDGDNTLERTIRMAKRVKAHGFKFMLDFHYSDTWADPGQQFVPRAWLSAKSTDDVAEKISAYTKEILTALNEVDACPDYVQIGNEINSGMICDNKNKGAKDFEFAGLDTKQVKYLQAASKAVRDFNKDTKIIVHLTSSNSPENLLNKLKTANLDYDIIGLSYYPWEKNHGTIKEMKENIKNWTVKYGKKVMIVETSAYSAGSDDVNSQEQLGYAKEHLVDPNGTEIYSDVELDSTKTYVLGTIENQQKILTHIFKEAISAGALGAFTWGGETGDWSHGMFDWQGNAFSSLDVFNAKNYESTSGSTEDEN